MKHITTSLDDETVRQMRELAELWGLPEIRHNMQVIARCVERVYQQEFDNPTESSDKIDPHS